MSEGGDQQRGDDHQRYGVGRGQPGERPPDAYPAVAWPEHAGRDEGHAANERGRRCDLSKDQILQGNQSRQQQRCADPWQRLLNQADRHQQDQRKRRDEGEVEVVQRLAQNVRGEAERPAAEDRGQRFVGEVATQQVGRPGCQRGGGQGERVVGGERPDQRGQRSGEDCRAGNRRGPR